MRISKHTFTNRAALSFMWLLAIIALLLTGVGYRVAASRLALAIHTPIILPVPLSSFPVEVDGWVSKDVPVPKYIQQAANNDDFLYRLFIRKPTGWWVTVYVAYSGRPRTMLGHRPQVCYVANGWVHESSVESQFLSSRGRPIPCSIHRFYKPGLSDEEIVVLNFYILSGQITRSESGFAGLKWRTPNISGDPAHYIAQVQISSVLENMVRAAAKDVTELILDFFPDKNGKIRAAQYPQHKQHFGTNEN
jgi:hypothetical protein